MSEKYRSRVYKDGGVWLVDGLGVRRIPFLSWDLAVRAALTFYAWS